MNKLTRRLMAGLSFVLAAVLIPDPLMAHHSFAMYDRSIQYVFTGVVESINPDASHLQIIFVPLNDGRDALMRDTSGDRVSWSVEMESAGASAREGISVSTFPEGTVFSVALVPLRNGEPGGARMGALFRCPTGTAPETSKHCDSVSGYISYGEGELASPTAVWLP